MGKGIRVRIAVVLAVLFFGVSLPTLFAEEQDTYALSIIHTNDTHAHLDTIANRVTAVKWLREIRPDALLLDAGDVFQGTLYFHAFKGQADVKFMNIMKYDAMTFGNHEFDLGATKEGHDALVNFVKAAKFPFVSANVDFSKDPKFHRLFYDRIVTKPKRGKIYRGIVKKKNGERIGIFGLTTKKTVNMSSPAPIEFENYLEEAEKAVQDFEEMGVNKIIVLSHLGYDDGDVNDVTLAKRVQGIDVIVGGHTHTTLKKPVVIRKDAAGKEKEPTVIVQTGSRNTNIGLLDVEFNREGVVKNVDGGLFPVADFPSDRKASKLLKKYKEKVDDVADDDIGLKLKKPLANPRLGDGDRTSVRSNETILGNLITDGMLQAAKKEDREVSLALLNGGGIRSEIDAGPVTTGDVIKVLPFSDSLVITELAGADLKKIFEMSVRNVPRENSGFLHIAGGKIEFDSSKQAGERVKNVYVKKGRGFVEVEDDAVYKIVTNSYLARGGEGYEPFAESYKAGKMVDLGITDWENFREYLSQLENVPNKVDGRVVDVRKKKK